MQICGLVPVIIFFFVIIISVQGIKMCWENISLKGWKGTGQESKLFLAKQGLFGNPLPNPRDVLR